MKIIILLTSIFMGSNVLASDVPCKAKAVRAAMSAYLRAGVIQGDDPIPSYLSIKNTGRHFVHSVAIDGGNDEGESWTVTYRVKTNPEPSCKVISVVELK